MAGLDGGDRLPGDAGHAGQLLLGQTAGLPGQPQPRPVRLGTLRHVPTSPSRVTCSLPYGASRELHAWPGASGTTTLSHRRGPDHHDAALPWFGLGASSLMVPASGVTAFTAPVIECQNTPDQGVLTLNDPRGRGGAFR